jgi:hypothetical protein
VHRESIAATKEPVMGGKNKGGREIRKPKQAKKPKTTVKPTPSLVPSTQRVAPNRPAK